MMLRCLCASLSLLTLLGVVAGTACTAHAQMQTGSSMKDYAKVFDLQGRRNSQFDVVLLDANAPGCIFYPGVTPKLTFQVQNRTDQPINATARLDVVAFGTRSIPGDIWKPEVYLIEKLPPQAISLRLPPRGWQNVTASVRIPERFGGYAMILDLGDKGRQLFATTVRAMKPDIPLVQFPSQALDAIDPDVLEQLGVRAVRWGVSFHSPNAPGYQEYLRSLDAQFRQFQKHGITVVAEIGAGTYDQPLGRPRPMLDDRGVMRDGKMDHVWLPSEDQNYKAFVKLLASKYGWPKGTLTGFMLWNEPWEGTSISGWQADMIRYRDLYKLMGQAVHEANAEAKVNVLVGGCDSSTNTWDKLFPDGSDEFLPYLDFVSIHYQGMVAPVLYRSWNQRKPNRVLVWDTESWVANSDDRVGAVVASNHAAGYDRAMGIYIGNLTSFNNFGFGPDAEVFQPDNSKRRRSVYPQVWPPAAALCAVQAMIGQRSFKEILFQNGLPWVYVFDGMNSNPDDGTLVILMDLGAVFSSPNSVPFRTVRSQAELNAKAKLRAQATGTRPLSNDPMPFTDAFITIDADPAFSLRDFFGNPLPPEKGKYRIPLDARAFFLRADPAKPGSFAKLVAAVRAGHITGIAPVEIQAHDFLMPFSPSMSLDLVLTNVLNRPVSGTLNATIANVTAPAQSVSLAANETRTFSIPVADLKQAADNRYPLHATFTSNDVGHAEIDDIMRINLIARRTITVDGKLEDWQDALPQIVQAEGRASQSVTEAAWLPFKSYDAGQSGGFATGYLAYDENYFYFAAKIADRTRDRGTYRFETLDADEFFYPQVATSPANDGSKQLTWPDGVRRFTYRKDPVLPSGCFPNFDNIQIAFNAIAPDDEPDLLTHLPGRPRGFVVTPDTDYEYALNTVSDRFGGGFEVWRLRVPGMPSKNFYPRQPKGPLDGPVKNAKLITRYEQNMRITELALPWSEIPHVKALLDARKPLKFSFHVNDDAGGPLLELARDRSVSRLNHFSFHVDWRESWSNEVQFMWQ